LEVSCLACTGEGGTSGIHEPTVQGDGPTMEESINAFPTQQFTGQ
jgi:hypothetical protein